MKTLLSIVAVMMLVFSGCGAIVRYRPGSCSVDADGLTPCTKVRPQEASVEFGVCPDCGAEIDDHIRKPRCNRGPQ